MQSLGQLYVKLVPPDAYLVQAMLRQNKTSSSTPGILAIPYNVILPRLFIAPLIVPVALVDALSYAIRGAVKATVKVIDLKFSKALEKLTKDELTALQSLALAVASVGTAVLGLFFGSCIYSELVPNRAPLADTLGKGKGKDEAGGAGSKDAPLDAEQYKRKLDALERNLQEGIQRLQRERDDAIKEMEAAKKNLDESVRKHEEANRLNQEEAARSVQETSNEIEGLRQELAVAEKQACAAQNELKQAQESAARQKEEFERVIDQKKKLVAELSKSLSAQFEKEDGVALMQEDGVALMQKELKETQEENENLNLNLREQLIEAQGQARAAQADLKQANEEKDRVEKESQEFKQQSEELTKQLDLANIERRKLSGALREDKIVAERDKALLVADLEVANKQLEHQKQINEKNKKVIAKQKQQLHETGKKLAGIEAAINQQEQENRKEKGSGSPREKGNT